MASPHDLQPVCDAAGPGEAHIIASMLRENGIEAFVFDTAAQTLLGDAPNLICPYMVHVKRKDIEQAKAFIRSNHADSIDLDWDEIDVGEMSDDGCLPPSTTQEDEADSFFFPIKHKIHRWVLFGIFVAAFLFFLNDATSS